MGSMPEFVVRPFAKPPKTLYPDSDGERIAENTLQFNWIVLIKDNLEGLFLEDELMFIAGDLLWYPVEGHPEIRVAPDVMVAIGRPKGYRGSYKQWEEGNIPPQVVFEILSPGNRAGEMMRKLEFYERYGVEEYYIIDPDTNEAEGYLRSDEGLTRIPQIHQWISPRLRIQFYIEPGEVILLLPDKHRFFSFEQMKFLKNEAFANLELESEKLELERKKTQAAFQLAHEQLERAEQEQKRVEKLAARLRELGINPDEI